MEKIITEVDMIPAFKKAEMIKKKKKGISVQDELKLKGETF